MSGHTRIQPVEEISPENWARIISTLNMWSRLGSKTVDLVESALKLRENNNTPTRAKDLTSADSLYVDRINAQLRGAGLAFRLYSPTHRGMRHSRVPHNERKFCFGLSPTALGLKSEPIPKDHLYEEYPMNLVELVGEDLSGFAIKEMTEVYRVDVDGRKSSTIGFFQAELVAQAFAQNQKGSSHHKTEKRLVLTNGEVGFLFQGEEITLLNDEEVALEIRKKALAKLSDEEKKILGL